MTRRTTARARTLIVVALLIAALTLLVALGALAQQADVGQPSGKSPTAFTPQEVGAPAQAAQRPATPGTSTSPGAPASRLQAETAMSATLSSGNVSFLTAAFYATGSDEATFVATADVNGDGKPDLLVANFETNTVAVLLGNGDGTFQSAVSYPSGGSIPATIIPVDLKGDGTIDLVVANQGCCPSGEGVISVLMGNGNGTFQSAVTYDSGGLGFANNGLGPAEIAVADVNGDGKLDIVVVNCASSGSSACGGSNGVVSVLLGNGDGTFQAAVSQEMGSPAGTGLVVADLNGDGKPDVAVTAENCQLSTDCAAGAVSVMVGNGNGTFQPGVIYPTGAWAATGLAVADLKGNGNLDLVVGGCGSSNCWTNDGTASVLLGNGDGTFQPAVVYDTGASLADGIAVANLNADGNLDVVVANVLGPSVGVLLGNGDGTLQPAVLCSAGENVYSVAIQDLNGDGKPDIAFATLGGSVGVLLNNTVPAKTTTTVTSSANPSLVNRSVTFTATVTSKYGTPKDGDLVTFSTLETVLSSVALAGGMAAYTTSTISAGTHFIKAAYTGDAAFKPSSGRVTQVVDKYATTTSLNSSLNPSQFGLAVTFTAQVTSSGPTPTGKVNFLDGTTSIGLATLSGGVATLTKSKLAVGTHQITAEYSGDADNAKATSPVLDQVVQ
jgi:hypothetical protein